MSEPIVAPFPLLPRSRLRRVLVLVAAYLALTSAFVCARFPVDRLAPRIAAAASAATGARVEIADLELNVIALLPSLHAREVAVTTPGGTRVRLDRMRVRPAWSLSWLRGAPALALSLRAGTGRVDGTLRLGRTPGFAGDLEQVDLRQLPLTVLADYGVSLDGKLGGEVDLRMGEQGPEGDLKLHAADGSLALPGLPIAVPFERLAAEATLGGDALARIATLTLDGPMVSLEANGTVGHAPNPAFAPLSLQGRVQVREPALRDLVADAGVALGSDGAANLAIGGTLAAPELGRGVRSPRPGPIPGPGGLRR